MQQYSLNKLFGKGVKINNNQKGFSAAEFILFTVIIGLIGGVGWFVWNQNKAVTQQELAGVVSNQETDTMPQQLKYPKEYIKSYSLPVGWREKKCKDNGIAVIPPKTAEPNCSLDQPNTIVSIGALAPDTGGATMSPKDCAKAIEQNEADKKNGYTTNSDFKCGDIRIDGRAGFKVVRKTTKDSFYGEATVTEYAINVDDNMQILTTYIGYPDAASGDLSSDVDTFISSFKF